MKPRGFTLIEILVVIVIIGVLATFITLSVLGAQVKARDSRRQVDYNTMSKVLADYYLNNAFYPYEYYCDSSIGWTWGTACPPAIPIDSWGTDSDFYREVVPRYIAKIPTDPLNNTTYYYYYEPANDDNFHGHISPNNPFGAQPSTGRYPVGQCYSWRFWTERGQAEEVNKVEGDVSWDNDGIIDCN